MYPLTRHRLVTGIFALVLAGMIPAISIAQFSEITTLQGIENINTGTVDGNGVSFCDIDLNGYDDVSFGRTNGTPLIYLNQNGTLTQATPSLPSLSGQQIKGQLWADYDNDGDRDLLICYWSDPVKLLRNEGDLVFTDVTAEAGFLSEDVNHFGAAWADVDRDGFLDLYICKYSNPGNNFGYVYTNRFYHNDGDGTFTDQTVASGLGGIIKSSFQAVFLDYNNDSWPDLYVINDKVQQENNLFRNDGDGTFTNVSFSSGAGIMIDAMTASVDDYDQDGYLDIYVSNNPTGNALLHNNGNGTFTNVAVQTGTILNITSWGCLWLDYDNDTWLDLFIGTTSGLTNPIQNYFLINDSGSDFNVGNSITGIDGDADPTFSVAQGDLNADGYYDYITNNNDPYASSLWLNDGGTNAYLAVTLEGTVSNRDGIGSWIECYTQGEKYVRFTTCGENYIGQNSFTEIFGLGNTQVVDSLVIRWPGGLVERYPDVDVNQHLLLLEGASLVSGPADISFNGDLFLCPGDSLVCTLAEGSGYEWTTGQQSQSIVIYAPGVYQATVYSSYGIPQNTSPFEVQWAPVLSWEQTAVSPPCNGELTGWVEVTIEPEPASFSWNTGASSYVLEGLGPDTLWWSAVSPWGCSYADTLILSQPDSLTLSLLITNPFCYGEDSGTAQATVNGGTGEYTLSWSNGVDPSQLEAGDYSLEVYDENGCMVTQEFTLNEPDQLLVTITTQDVPLDGTYGSAVATASGGTPPYSIEWSSGVTENWSVDELIADDYFAIVSDSLGCTDTVSFSILVRIDEFTIHSGPFFFPNPADHVLEVRGSMGSGEIQIYAPDGQLTQRHQVLFDRSMTQRIYIGDLQPGMYQVRLLQNERLRSGILIKK